MTDPLDSHELLYLLTESSNDVVWTMSVTGESTYVSPAVERMRGYTQAEAMAQPFDEIQPPESAAITKQYSVDLHTAPAGTGVSAVEKHVSAIFRQLPLDGDEPSNRRLRAAPYYLDSCASPQPTAP